MFPKHAVIQRLCTNTSELVNVQRESTVGHQLFAYVRDRPEERTGSLMNAARVETEFITPTNASGLGNPGCSWSLKGPLLLSSHVQSSLSTSIP